MNKSTKEALQIARKYVNILGINVLSTTREEVLTGVKENISDNVKFSITTPNPELVLASTKDSALKNALNSSDYSVPDGIGLAQSAKFLSFPIIKAPVIKEVIYFVEGLVVGVATFINKNWLTDKLPITKGRILFNELIKSANENDWKVFLLGGESGEAEVVAKKLMIHNSSLQIQFFQGPMVDNNADPKTENDRKLQKEAVNQINDFKPQILFVAMKNPKQEIWIHKNLSILNVGGAMTVGGTFRYISGLSPLPPKWMGEYGLEWVCRLITEPYRIKRILNAFPIFPLKVFEWKLRNLNTH